MTQMSLRVSNDGRQTKVGLQSSDVTKSMNIVTVEKIKPYDYMYIELSNYLVYDFKLQSYYCLGHQGQMWKNTFLTNNAGL